MTLAGRFTDLPLSDLIQVLSTNSSTCRVDIQVLEDEGELFMENGEIVHAQFGRLSGEEAVYAFLAASDQARFKVQANLRTGLRTVHEKTISLLLEGLRRLDEGIVSQPAAPVPPTSSPSVSASGSGYVAPSAAASVAPSVSRAPTPPPPRRPSILQTVVIAIGLFAVGVAGGLIWFSGEPTGALSRVGQKEAIDASELTGPKDRKPRLLRGRSPVAPKTDQTALSPSIVCRILVQPDGTVSKGRVYRPREGMGLFESVALAAVERFMFEPALKDGIPTAAWINWPVSFESSRSKSAVQIRVKGSDTIGGALGPALAAAYEVIDEDVAILIDALGSSTGFAGLFDGSADLAASSRPIKSSEVDEAERLGIKLKEHVIGYDGIAVVVHRDNPVASLSIDQLRQLFSGEIKDWSELGGLAGPVEVVSRPSYSGTHGFFRDRVLRAKGSKASFASSTRYFETNHELVDYVAAHPNALTFIGLGWAQQDGVRILPISDGGTPVAPTKAAIRDGGYPISRALLMYTRGLPRGHLAGFLRFILSVDGQRLVARHGFVDSEADVDAVVAPALVKEPMAVYEPLVFRIYFGSGRTDVDATATKKIETIARRLRTGAYSARIVGNSDSQGSQQEKQAVSLARADFVRVALVERGVAASLLEVGSVSATRPRGSNTTRGGRRENRRVDVTLLPR